MNHYRYLFDSEFSCIVKLTSNGTEVQRFSIPRSDLMKLALVCWKNSIDRLFTEGYEE